MHFRTIDPKWLTQNIVTINEEADSTGEIDLQMYVDAYSEWLSSKFEDIINVYKNVEVSTAITINFIDDKLVIVGSIRGISFRVMDEVLSFAEDYDLSGTLELGLSYTASFPEDFFNEYFEKDDKKETDENEEPEEETDDDDVDDIKDDDIDNASDEVKEMRESKDHIDLNKGLVTKWFDHFNNLLFGNRLILPPISFMRSKYVLASVVSNRKVNELGKYPPISFKFSRFYKLDLTTFKGIMVHEMIHIELLQYDGIVSGKDGHGDEFEYRRVRLNKQVEFDVPRTENAKLEVDSKSGKRWDVIVFNQVDGSKSMLVYKSGYLSDKLDEVQSIFAYWVTHYNKKGDFSIEVYNTGATNVAMYRQKRNLKTTNAQVLDSTLAQEIKDEGKLIYTVK